MSQQLIDRSPDLQKFRGEGYNLLYKDSHLIVWDIPYLNAQGELCTGMFISTAELQGDFTSNPVTDHTVYFCGEMPCASNGTPLDIVADTAGGTAAGLRWNFRFSVKFTNGSSYTDYYQKFKKYIACISGPARLKYNVTAATRQAIEADEDDSVFVLQETWSSSAQISSIVNRLKGQRVGIVGLGGTGSHILDLVAKTPVLEIHLYDGDVVEQKNIWRFAGATPRSAVDTRSPKVEYFSTAYAALRRGIIPHAYHVTDENVAELLALDFIFISVDSGSARELIARALHGANKPFIDVGMGIDIVQGEQLGGLVRTTLVVNGDSQALSRLPTGEGNEADAYAKNIQIVDMNCLNAALAVIRWKKFNGIYADMKGEWNAHYAITTNKLINSTQAKVAET